MKIKHFLMILCGVLLLTTGVHAGTVKTKDQKSNQGGYYNDGYHLKKKGEKKNFVDRDDHWHSPFKGFTKKAGKPKKRGEMPHG